MRELDPMSFDRALRDASGVMERRTPKGEPTHDALPDALVDEETLAWLRELRGKDPLAEALERWLLRVREQAHLARRRAELGRAHRVSLHAISEPERSELPLSELLRLGLARPRERAAYLRSYFRASAEVAELVTRLWEERQMFAHELTAPLDSFEVVSPALAPAARAFLVDTRAAYETLQVHDPDSFLTAALAESAHEGWPAHLSPRTVTGLVDRLWLEGLRVRPFALPRAYGGTSFLLALAQLGRALSDAAGDLRSPFVLARDVFDLRRHELAALLGGLPISAAFAARQLGLGPSRSQDHVRALARSALVDTRVAAFRVLLRELLLGGPSTLRRELAELSHGALGFELPAEVVGAFIRVRPRDSQRFAGALLAATKHQLLVDVHDDDWFRNPRAIREVRAEMGETLISDVTEETLSTGAQAFRRRLEPLL